jgi:hypothetical protein
VTNVAHAWCAASPEWVEDVLAIVSGSKPAFPFANASLYPFEEEYDIPCNEWEPNNFRWKFQEQPPLFQLSPDDPDPSMKVYLFEWGFEWKLARYNNSRYKGNNDSGFEWSTNFRFNDPNADALCTPPAWYEVGSIDVSKFCRPRMTSMNSEFGENNVYYQDNYFNDAAIKVGMGAHAMDTISPDRFYDSWVVAESPLDFSSESQFYSRHLLYTAIDESMSCYTACSDNYFFKNDSRQTDPDNGMDNFPVTRWAGAGIPQVC